MRPSLVVVVVALTSPFSFALSQEAADTSAAGSDSMAEGPSRPEPVLAPTFAQWLIGRYPGVLVYPSSGVAGTGARIRIRGSGSLALSNEPAVYVDGVRVEADERGLTFSFGPEVTSAIAGRVTSRLNDFDPDDVDSIVIVRGPSAGVMHGPELVTGAIHLYTRQGRTGPPRWRAYVEGGGVSEVTPWPANYGGVDADHADSAYRNGRCTLQATAAGLCVQDYVPRFAPLVAREQFRGAQRQQYGLAVIGGRGSVTYALGGAVESEGGVYELSRAEIDRLEAGGAGPVPTDVVHPAHARRSSIYGNLGIALGSRARATLGVFRRTSDARFPPEWMLREGLTGSSDSMINDGWRQFRPGDVFQLVNFQEVDRFGGNVRLAWRPTAFFEVSGLAGFDDVNQRDAPYPQPNRAVLHDATVRRRTYAVDGTFTFALPRGLSGRARLAVQRFDYRLDARFYERFTSPFDTLVYSSRELRLFPEFGTTSIAAEQRVSWRDRMALDLGLRVDDLEVQEPVLETVSFNPFPVAIPPEPGKKLYPAVALSWVPVAAPRGIVDRLSLRLGYGAAGRRIGRLEPERTTELELGAAAVLLGGRAGLELRGYSQTTSDAFVQISLAPSVGGVGTARVSGARVSNRGVELSVTAAPVRTERVAWDVTVGAWGNRNRLGGLFGPPFVGLQKGYPVSGYTDHPIEGYADANGDGIIVPGEVRVGFTPVWLGSAAPTQGATFATGVTLWDRVRIGGLLEYRAGHVLLNETARFRCLWRVCPELQERGTPLDRQAAAVAPLTQAGFIEDADYLKLREVSLAVTAPPSVSRAVRARRVQVTLAGRNLATWTGYSGFDPEVNSAAQDGNLPYRDAFAQPPVRYWSVRFDVTY